MENFSSDLPSAALSLICPIFLSGLVVDWTSPGFQNGLDATRHAVDEAQKRFRPNTFPHLFNGLHLLGTSVDVCASDQTLLDDVPHVFDWVQVGAVRWLLHHADFPRPKPADAAACLVTRRIVLLKDNAFPVRISFNEWGDSFTQDLHVTDRIQGSLDESERQLFVANNATPDHHLWWVFYCGAKAFLVKPLVGTTIADLFLPSWKTLDDALVRKDYAPPLLGIPELVRPCPCQTSLAVCRCQKRLANSSVCCDRCPLEIRTNCWPGDALVSRLLKLSCELTGVIKWIFLRPFQQHGRLSRGQRPGAPDTALERVRTDSCGCRKLAGNDVCDAGRGHPIEFRKINLTNSLFVPLADNADDARRETSVWRHNYAGAAGTVAFVVMIAANVCRFTFFTKFFSACEKKITSQAVC